MTARRFLDIYLANWRWLCITAWALAALLYLTLPPSPDQFNHAYMGWRLLEGDVPYRDFVDQNWPGVVGLHALAVALFGVNLWSWRAFDFLLFAASSIALSDLVRLAVNRDAQRISLALLPLIYVSANYWIAGQQDMSSAQFLVGALWCNVRAYEKKSLNWQFVSGLFLALAILNKPTVGVIAILLPLQALWLGATVPTILTQTGVLFVSTVAAVMASFGFVVAQGATTKDIYDVLYTFSIARREMRSPSILQMALVIFSGSRHPWFLPSLIASLPAAAWLIHKSNRSAPGVSLVVLWLTGLISYFIQGSIVGYHLAPSLIAMAGANAITIYLVASNSDFSSALPFGRKFGAALCLVIVLTTGLKLAYAYYSLPSALIHGDLSAHWKRFPTGNGDVTVKDTIDFINRMRDVGPDDCILVIGVDSALNYLSRHPQPTRFYYFDVLANTQPSLPMAARWTFQWRQDLSVASCPIALISEDIVIKWLPLDRPIQNALRSFLTNYRQVGTLGANYGDIVFRRKSDYPVSMAKAL